MWLRREVDRHRESAKALRMTSDEDWTFKNFSIPCMDELKLEKFYLRTSSTAWQAIPKRSRILEIGSFEGCSMVYWTHFCEPSELVCIDLWEPTKELGKAPADAEARWDHNADVLRRHYPNTTITKVKRSSFIPFGDLGVFDLVYVDGSHTAWHAMHDIMQACDVLRVGGHLVVDDFRWYARGDTRNSPYPGVVAFFDVFAPFFTVVSSGHQIWLRKDKEPLATWKC